MSRDLIDEYFSTPTDPEDLRILLLTPEQQAEFGGVAAAEVRGPDGTWRMTAVYPAEAMPQLKGDADRTVRGR